MIPQRAPCANDYKRAVAIWTGDIHYNSDGSFSGLTRGEFEAAMLALDASEPVGKSRARSAKPHKAKRKRRCVSLVKTRRKHPRKSSARDDRALTIIEGLKGISIVGAGVCLSTKPLSSTAKAKALKGANDNRDLPRWQDAGDLLKGSMFNEALAKFGTPRTLSLNISQEVIDKAQAGRKGFASNMLEMIRNELRREKIGGVEIWIVVEVNREGRLHIHGGFVCADDHLERVKAAFRRAGGVWDDGNQGRQIDEKPQYDRPGWARYCLKDVSRTQKHVSGSMLAKTAGVNKAAKEILEQFQIADRQNRAA